MDYAATYKKLVGKVVTVPYPYDYSDTPVFLERLDLHPSGYVYAVRAVYNRPGGNEVAHEISLNANVVWNHVHRTIHEHEHSHILIGRPIFNTKHLPNARVVPGTVSNLRLADHIGKVTACGYSGCRTLMVQWDTSDPIYPDHMITEGLERFHYDPSSKAVFMLDQYCPPWIVQQFEQMRVLPSYVPLAKEPMVDVQAVSTDSLPNMTALGSGMYLVRTQAGFKQALKHADCSEAKLYDTYPKSYPCVISLTLGYDGSSFVHMSYVHVNDLLTALRDQGEI